MDTNVSFIVWNVGDNKLFHRDSEVVTDILDEW